MDVFDYPIDTKALRRKKAAIREELLKHSDDFPRKKIAVLGGSTTNEVVEQLELFLLHNKIKGEFYQSEYGMYWQDAMFGNRELDGFHPDIIYIHTSWRNIKKFPAVDNSPEEADQLLASEYEYYENMWQTLRSRFQCPIIQNNFDRPDYRLLGNRDIWDYRGRSNFISRLNQKLYKYACENNNFYINDLEYISQDYGLSDWGNPIYWHMYKYAMCPDAIPYVAESVANIIKSIYGKNKKLLALDLDNTIWGGVIGDDGVEGISIGRETSKGQVYSEFQEYCKALRQIGVVLAINSKNDMENAIAGLNHPDSVLKPEDFVCIKANWNPKDRNMQEIADELSLGTDSFVFADDNPAEGDIVKSNMPEVAVPAMNAPENYIRILDHSGYFEVTSLSSEDTDKTKLYHAKAQAAREAKTFSDYGDYLASLNMTAVITAFEAVSISRIAQLTNKSNQFNLTTLRCSEADIKKMQENPDYICLCGRLSDKFGDNGIVIVTAGEAIGHELHIRLWLMSCRVLKRELEDAMMNVLVAAASDKGINSIIGYYYKTAKNGMVKDFYQDMGFELSSQDGQGNTIWRLNTGSYKAKKPHMTIETHL